MLPLQVIEVSRATTLSTIVGTDLFIFPHSYGVLFVGFKEEFPTASNATISGAGSLVVCLIHLAAPITPLLLQLGLSARQIVFSGGICVAAGCILTAYIKVRLLASGHVSVLVVVVVFVIVLTR